MEWEYKILRFDDGGLFGGSEEPSEATLNELGAEGWELVDSLVGTNTKLGRGRASVTNGLVFKRPAGAESDGAASGSSGRSER